MLNMLDGGLLDDTMQNEILFFWWFCITPYIAQRHKETTMLSFDVSFVVGVNAVEQQPSCR